MAAKKPKTVRAVHANRGIEAKYRKAMDGLIEEMARSTEYWLKAQYRKDPPEMAEDGLPAAEMASRVKGVAKRWISHFNSMASDIAKKFAAGTISTTDNSFQNALKDAGWVADFKMTRAMQDIAKASIVENVALIRSIPQQYFTQVEGIVMRGYSAGRDLEQITKDLEARYGITKRRAAFIARDQCNKLNADAVDARRKELGIVEAEWMHSHGGKEPRKSHIAADKKRYKISEGCLIDGEHIKPGEKPGCRCTSKSVLPF